MQKIRFFILFTLSTLLLTQCKPKENNLNAHEPIISFSVRNISAQNIYMYSCQGTRQMLVDSIPIQLDSASIIIPEGTPAGIYRFVVEQAIVDLIVSNEDISVHLDGSNPNRPIEIEKSRENKWLYDFLYTCSEEVSGDTISCSKISSLKQTFLNENTPPLASEFVALILQSFNCDLEPVCIRLLTFNSPYADGAIKSILVERSKTEEATRLLEDIKQCSDTAREVQHEIYTACWDAGIEADRQNLLKAVLQENEEDFIAKYTQLTTVGKINTILSGSPFPIVDVLPEFIPNSKNLYYIIIHDESDVNKISEIASLKNYLSKAGDTCYEIAAQSIPDEIKRQIGYVIGPMIFMVGKNDILADKWVGYRDIQTLR